MNYALKKQPMPTNFQFPCLMLFCSKIIGHASTWSLETTISIFTFATKLSSENSDPEKKCPAGTDHPTGIICHFSLQFYTDGKMKKKSTRT